MSAPTKRAWNEPRLKKGERAPRRYRAGDRVVCRPDYGARVGTLVRRIRNFPQWQVKLDSGRTTFWWESDFSRLPAGGK